MPWKESEKRRAYKRLYKRAYRKRYPEKARARDAVKSANKTVRMRDYMLAWKSVPCTVCGHSINPKIMEAHHICPVEKDKNAGKMGSWRTLESELEKCIPVCPNCHAAIHIGDHPEYLDERGSTAVLEDYQPTFEEYWSPQ